MRTTAVAVCLLLSALLCGLACGTAGATPTTYYWISPCDDYVREWSGGPPDYTRMCDHDGVPGPYYIYVDGSGPETGPLLDEYRLSLRDSNKTPSVGN